MTNELQAKAAVDYHVKETNVDSVSTLKTIGWQVLIDSALAVGAVLVAVMDQLAPAIASMVPGWAAALVVAGLAAIKMALSKYIQTKHTGAVTTALATDPPEVIKRAYGVR